MSARMLKKLQGADPLAPPSDEDNDHLTDNDELDSARDKKSHLNPFDLLNLQSVSESEIKDDDEDASAATNTSNAAKKKKRKRKKKVKCGSNHISSEDNEVKYFENVDPLLGKVYDAVPKQSEKKDQKNLLSVELKHLNAQNEMRRTFGKRVVKVENKRGRQKPTLKFTHMVTSRESWPPLTKNIITMKSLPAPDIPSSSSSSISKCQIIGSEQWFAFEHSPYYQGVQHMFLSALERTDSDFLINLIKRCPYHVDSLIQLSELCKMTEDFALASELIERALLLLESSLHINFSLGNSRMDYRRQENRAFFIVLFKHCQYLEERACCRTAFEISKLLMSLQPDVDPLAMILVIDYYALRSKQYNWLVDYYEQNNDIRNLAQLPNMAYSYALALFLSHGVSQSANEALQYALLMFPGVLRPLLDAMSVQTDKRVLSSPYFQSEVSGSQSPALHQLVCLYVCRAKIVWRQNEVLPWLEANVNTALDRIDKKDSVIEEYKEKRDIRYGTPPRAILRHVVLSDFKEKVPLAIFVSKESQAIMTYDPLPPVDTVNCYQRKSSSSSSPTTNAHSSVSMFFQSLLPSFNLNNIAAAAAAAQQEQQRIAPLAALAAQAQPAGQRVENGDNVLVDAPIDGGEGASGSSTSNNELSQRLTTFMEAMRDLLHNFSIADQAAAAHSSTNDDDEEGSSDYVD